MSQKAAVPWPHGSVQRAWEDQGDTEIRWLTIIAVAEDRIVCEASTIHENDSEDDISWSKVSAKCL